MANRELMITLGLDTSSYSQNVKRAKDLNNELDSSFKLLSSSSEKFEDSIEGLAKKQDYLEEKLKVATALTQVYSDRLKESEKALYDATQKSAKHKDEIESLNKSLEEGSIDQKTYEEKLKSATQQFDKAEKAVATHNKRILEAKVGYNQTQIAMQDLTKQTTLVSEKLNNMKADEAINGLKDNIKGLNDKLSNSKEVVEGFSDTITGLNKTQEVYAQSIKESKSLLSAYGEEVQKSTQYVDKYQKELDATTKELKEWEEILESIDITDVVDEDEFKEACKLFDEARVEVEALRAEYTQINTAIEYHNKRLSEMKSGYKNTEKNIASFENELNNVNSSIKKINQQKIFDNLDNQIKNINGYIEVLNSKLEMANSTMKDYSKTKEGLNTKTEIYIETVQQLKRQLELLNTTLNENEKELTELRQEQDLVAQSISSVRAEMLKVDKDSPEYDKQVVALARLEKSYDDLEKEINDFQSENYRLQSEINTTTAEINNMARETNELSKSFYSAKFEDIGNSFSKFGQVANEVGQALAGVSVVFSGLQALVISTGTTFETSMSKVNALTGATVEDFERLETTAREMAKVTVYTASESADALGYLALAGYGVQESIDALPHILNTAMAGAMDLATASDKATDAFASLGEQGKDLETMLNMVAQTSASSNTSVEQMLDAFIKVGGQLETLNIPLETASSMLGVLANRGIKAEEAGNSLNSILINMTKATGESSEAMAQLGVSMFDEAGNIREVEEVFLDLSKALSGLSEQEQVQLINMIGGKTQAKTLQKLLQGMVTDTGEFTEEYKELKAEIENAPNMDALANMASTMTDNLGGDLDILTSQIQESFLVIFDEIEPRLREFVQLLTEKIEEITEWFVNLDDGTQNFILALGVVLAIASPVLIVIGSIANGLSAMFSALSWCVDKFPTFNKKVEGAGGQVTDLNKKMQKLVDDIPKMVSSIKNYSNSVGSLFSNLSSSASSWISNLGSALVGGLASSGLSASISGLLGTIGGWITTAFGTIFSVAGAKFIAIGALIVGAIYLIYKAIKYLYDNWDNIISGMKEAWSTAMEWIAEKAEWIKEKFNLFIDGVKNGFDSMVNFFKELPSKIEEFLKSIPNTVLNILNTVFDTILKALAMGIANAIGLIVTIGKQIYDVFSGAFTSLGGVFDVVVGLFTLNFEKVKEGVVKIFSGIWDIISNSFKNAWAYISGAFENIMSIFNIDASGVIENIENFFLGVWTKFTTWLSTLWNDVTTWFTNMIQQVPLWLTEIGVALGTWLVETWTSFTTWLSDLWTSFTTWSSDMLTKLTTWLSEMKTNLLTWITETWNNFLNWLNNLWNSFLEWCSKMKNKLVTWLSEFAKDPIGFMKNFATNIANGLNEAWNKFLSWCSKMISKLGSWFSELISKTWTNIVQWASKFSEGAEKIIGFFKELPSKMLSIGKDMINSLWNGFKSKLNTFAGWVKDGVSNIIGNLFRSTSPSIDAEVNYNEANAPTTLDTSTASTPLKVSYARDSFADMGSMINDVFKKAFSLDDYKTTGGFYSPNSVRTSGNTSNSNSSILEALIEQNQLLIQILTNNTIEVGVNVDGRQIAKASAKYMETEISTISKRKTRLGGAF